MVYINANKIIRTAPIRNIELRLFFAISSWNESLFILMLGENGFYSLVIEFSFVVFVVIISENYCYYFDLSSR